MKRHRLTLDLPASVKKQILRLAKKENRTITEIVRRAVDAYEANSEA